MTTQEAWILTKPNALLYVGSLAGEMQIIAPRRMSHGDIIFGPIGTPKEIAWEYGHDLYPPKRFVLPPFEDMIRYRDGKEPRIEDASSAPPQAIIGIRSCDVSAIRFQERFFESQIVDSNYKARADNTLLVSLVCNTPPRKECFCICCDSGPYLDANFDIQLTDLGDKFLYEVGSDKGQQATEPRSYLLAPAQAGDLAERRRIELQADSLFETTAYFAKTINFISDDQVPDAIWDELGSTCFRCGACTNLCPVCTCYTVDDFACADGSFLRCRSWDSCQYGGFTREASGHNPRPTHGTRVQRRFYHKASYQYVMRDGKHGCVGCGRCEAACLTNLGVPNVLKRIRRSMHEYLEPKDEVAEV